MIRGKVYLTLTAVEDRNGTIVGFKPEGVTVNPPKVPKGIPIELEIEIDEAVFRPLKISGGTVTIAAPPSHVPSVVPPPPVPAPAPTTMYGKALAAAQAKPGRS